MSSVINCAAEAVNESKERLSGAVDENLRHVRRAVAAGRLAVEDYAAEAGMRVRRHPLVSLSIAAGVGTLVGCLIGFTVARRGGHRPVD